MKKFFETIASYFSTSGKCFALAWRKGADKDGRIFSLFVAGILVATRGPEEALKEVEEELA